LISVIIPCYNLGQYIEEAINSVLQQTFQDFEIIVVNDGSDDPYTVQLLHNNTWPGVSIFHTSNRGASSSRNFGIESAKGEFICCLDADDKLHPSFLEKTLLQFSKDTNREMGIVTTWVKEFGLSDGIWKTRKYDPISLLHHNELHVASLFRKQCWIDCGGYSTNINGYEDWDFWIKIVACNWKWDVCEEILFYYRKRPNSLLSSTIGRKAVIYKQIIGNNKAFFEKYHQELIIKFVEAEEKKELLIRNIQTSFPFRSGYLIIRIFRLIRRILAN
jgi:O-antigen biosynthesis protein